MGLFSLRKLMSRPIAQQRDRTALLEIHNAAYPVIFHYIAFRVGDKAAAEQLTEELFTLMLEEPDTNQADPDFPHRLLLSLATKAVQNYQRHGPHPPTTAVSQAKIQGAIAALSEEHQILLALMYGCGLSLEQVALALDQSSTATRLLQARAIIALHAKMQCH